MNIQKSLMLEFRFKKVFLKREFIYFQTEGKGGRKREGEKHQCVVASHMPTTGNLAHNPGMCPDLGIQWVTILFLGWCSIH